MAGESRKAVVGAVAANLVIAVAKFIAAAITGSAAMLSEGIHSLVDTGDGLLLLVGERRSKHPADAAHPFGYGHELYFWAFVVAVNVFAVGGGISTYEGVLHLLHPRPLEDPTWNYVVLGVAAVAEGVSWRLGFRALRRERAGRTFWRTVRETKDPRSIAVVFEDTAALGGITLAFAGVFLGHLWDNRYLDGVASVLIGLELEAVALLLARETKGLLIGEPASRRTLDRARGLLEADRAVDRVGRLLSLQLAPDEVLLTAEVAFDPGLDGSALVEAVERLRRRLREELPDVRHLFVELGRPARSEGGGADAGSPPPTAVTAAARAPAPRPGAG